MRSYWRRLFAASVPLVFSLTLAGPADCTGPRKNVEGVLELRGLPVMFVEAVVSRSAAEAAGISRFDLVAGFNGLNMRQFPTAESFVAELRIAAIKDKADVEVLKFVPETGAYSSSSVTVSLAGSAESHIGLRSTFAYVILEVSGGGVAEKMGVTPGDFIEEVEGKQVANLRGALDLDNAFEEIASQPGREFMLSVARWAPDEEGGRRGEIRKLKGSF